jgi:hypothetical protein
MRMLLSHALEDTSRGRDAGLTIRCEKCSTPGALPVDAIRRTTGARDMPALRNVADGAESRFG